MKKAIVSVFILLIAILSFSACEEEEKCSPHVYTSEVTQEATCTADGVKTYSCINCDHTYTEPIVTTYEHVISDGRCRYCNEPESTEGLEYSYSEETDSYTVIGIGDSTATDIVIGIYNGKNVTAIAYGAFENSSTISSVTVGNSVLTIGSFAFYDCDNLTSVRISAGVKTVQKQAFSLCDSLTVYCEAKSMPSAWDLDWKTADGPAVWDCNNNDVATDGYVYTVIDGVRYGIKDEVATVVRQPKGIETAEIKSSITHGSESYDVESISGYAFTECNSLTSVTIPDSIETVGECAFNFCNSLTVYCEAESAASDWDFFWNILRCPVVWDCNNNDAATDGYVYTVVDGLRYGIKDGCATVASQSYSIKTADIKPSITYNSESYTVKSISEGAFSDCTSLTRVTVPESIESIGEYAFSSCDSLAEIIVEEENCFYKDIDGSLYTKDGKALVRYAIGKNETSFDIPYGVTKIHSYAFADACTLASVTVPYSVENVLAYAFDNCTGLTIYCETAKKPSDWNSKWNYDECPTVWNCSINDVATDGYIYTVVDGIRYSIKDIYVAVATQPRGIKEAEIKSSITYKNNSYKVTGISDYAFAVCANLTSVTIGDNVNDIGDYAFKLCLGLKDVIFGESVKTIGDYAFSYCSRLNGASIPVSVKNIGSFAFAYCPRLENLIIGNGVEYIDPYAFIDCDSLVSVTIGTNVKSIPSYSFYGCDSLTGIVIPGNVKTIDEYAFYNCQSLSSVTVSNGVEKIGDSAFADCRSLTSVKLSSGVKSIHYSSFHNCDSLTIYCEQASKPGGWDWGYSNEYTVVWNSNSNDVATDGYVYTVIDGVRYGIKDEVATVVRQPKGIKIADIKSTITYNSISYSVKEIADSAFADCQSLVSVTLGNCIETIGASAFADCDKLEYILISDSVKSIGASAFLNCGSIKSVTIGNGVENIGSSAFANCEKLVSVTIVSGVEIIGTSAFANCYALADVVMEYGVKNIGVSAFMNCESLTSVDIPSSVTIIGNEAFCNCSSLERVTVPSSVTDMRKYVFYRCDNLTIYCEAASQPSGWNANWNASDCLVFWDCK